MQRLSRRAHPAGAAALAAASATCAAAMLGSQSSHDGALAESPAREEVSNDARHNIMNMMQSSFRPGSVRSSLSTRGPGHQSSIHTDSARHPTPLASSPINSIKDDHASIEEDAAPTQPNRNRIECDYVVIGHGKAGRSAVRTLRRLDPSAHIVIIDPNNTSSQSAPRANKSTRRKVIFGTSDGSIRHIPTRAGYIDHAKKLIHVHPISSVSGDEVTDGVHFRKSALLATGSRGAPPPEGCIRHDAYERILELRSTALPQSALGSTLPAVKDGQPQHYPSFPAMAESQPQATLLASSSQGAKSTKTMPVLDPPTVRSLSIMAASQGATVAVMGSGFDALELAAACARASPHDKDSNDRVMLLFGNSSPMSQRLPRYLGAAVTKRLRQFGIGVEDRALTRYISMDNGMGNSNNNLPPRLELYAVKSYDHLDSSRMNADLLVLSPSVRDLNGTAVVPTPTSASTQCVEHVPWSSLITPPLLTCYLHDGRIATNAEFNAASSLYAAGSVARYPDNNTGRAEIAGGRHICSEQSGVAAARSMVGASGIHDQGGYLTESIHVWRSDVVSYLPDASTDNMNNENSAESPRLVHPASTQALYSMGIHALCIGKCDSEGMATHGFWWTNTNQSSDSKNGNGSKGSSNSGTGRSIGPNAFMRRATRRTNCSSSKSSSRGYLPVYGSGVVFYLDRSGNIEGVMLWGLPFSQDPKDVRSDLNDELVERIKDMIRSNGGVAIRDYSKRILEENPGTNIDVGLLSYLHLMAESKHLVSMALSGSMAEQNQPGQSRVSVRGRPLHRYTPIKPVELTNLGKLARRDELGHLAEEDDLFYTAKASSYERADEAGRPPSLKRVYPMQGGVSLAGTKEHELEREMDRRRLRIERSRPPKEEPLWLRQGEEHRFVNRRDAWAESFLRNVQAGRFSDGTDAVMQAPVPKAYLDAKEMFSSWAENDDEKDD